MSETIKLNPQDIEALLGRAKTNTLIEEDCKIIATMADVIFELTNAIDKKAAHIKKLLRMLFGDSTEKTSNILKNEEEEPKAPENGSSDPEDSPEKIPDKPKKKKKVKGHGRNGASDYTGAEKIKILNKDLRPFDSCPYCLKGKVYDTKKPAVTICMRGCAPLSGTVCERETLRCNLCGEIFRPELPDTVNEEKHDAAGRSMIALLKYGGGFPFNRLAQLQASLGLPLAVSTQWDLIDEVARKIMPIYELLKYYAAQGDIVHNDDTVMKILEMMAQNKKDAVERKGIFTTGVLSIHDDYMIAMFISGRKHAGENLNDILTDRNIDLSLPIQMCDALDRNLPKDFKTILANCLAHARRKFIEVEESFPEECTYLLKTLGKIYKNDAIAKKEKMSPEERLKFHQEKSGPLMEGIKTWIEESFAEKKVEPNSSLGKAMTYMLNHWEPLTCFLRVPKAPLDNNLCEQALKKAILHRKNSLFYKTKWGAYVGDLFMSLIHTCNLCKVNPLDYLNALQENADAEELRKNPHKWMPWNFQTSK